MRSRSPKLSKSEGLGRLHGRPIPAIHRPVKMLRSQPALPTFAAPAQSSSRWTTATRDKAPFRCVCAKVGFAKVCGVERLGIFDAACITGHMGSPNELTIVFDTDCLMCSAWVRFVLRHERGPTARFVSAWSEEGLAIAGLHNLTPQDLDKTYLVVFRGQPLTKSDATFAILKTLRAPWHWGVALSILPRSLRDRFYDLIAKNRYRWFGQKDQCFLPPEGQRARFVLGPPRSTVLPDHR